MKSRCFLIKPASGACNMKCTYCFYRDEVSERSVKNYGMMSEETADILIKRALEETDGPVAFAFQGGEPSLMGLDWYRHFVSAVHTLDKNHRSSFAFQTNGYIIDREWASFFRENNFLVGLSMDGSRRIHDMYRRGNDGEGSFRRVYAAAEALSAENAQFNILVTVTRDVAENIETLMPFFLRNGFRYLQFIPCLDPLGDKGQEYSLTPDIFTEFLKKLFVYYYNSWRDGHYVSIRYFDNLVSMKCGNPPEECGMAGVCSDSYCVVEADGSVFPCDFYVLDGYEMGNIRTDSLSSLDKKRKEMGFVEQSLSLPEECRTCSVFSLCHGGCRRERENYITGEMGLNRLCSSYREFLTFADKALSTMAYWETEAKKED